MLELAVLGLLHEAPMHGYELRRQLREAPGAFRACSCGTLYPTLRRMLRAGLIEEVADDPAAGSGRRARRVYRLTADGVVRFDELVGECGPQACEDASFGVHVAFFSRTPADVRLRLLERRRLRVEEQRDGLLQALARSGNGFDRYLVELHRLQLDRSEREVRWLDEIIRQERAEQATSVEDRPRAGANRKDITDEQ
ncbi:MULTISPECIES: PadR family transcriptional regulator [Saccharopolyspora]|uniref:PadR family transcriptional regulator n=1 Tax=Saccharopolyspora cebuensis TaxID=418759 RepID=A0ABV4CP58_9PSEU